jgi:hypothetical protein
MTDSPRIQILGPRSWAALVLAGGAALSAPFLRSTSNPAQTPEQSGNPAAVDFSKKSWPDVREKTLTPAGSNATNLSNRDWVELERLKANAGVGPRKLSGTLPSTSTTPLPSWADRGPRVDQLVNDSIRTQPLAPTPAGATGLDPLRPWIGTGMKTNAEPPSAAQEAGLAGDIVFRAPHPDAAWNSGPSNSQNHDASSQDSLPGAHQDSGALASDRPFRKFEDHVKQWPDEKMLPPQVPSSQFAWGHANVPPSDRNVVRPSSNWPPVAQPPAFSVGSQTRTNQPIGNPSIAIQSPPSPANPNTVSEIRDTVSAPMVSSQSGRQSPPMNGPTIESPKPASPAAPRQKHYIQQPVKRA